MKGQITVAVFTALLVGFVQFGWNQATHAAERMYWAKYAQGAAEQHDYWARYVGDKR